MSQGMARDTGGERGSVRSCSVVRGSQLKLGHTSVATMASWPFPPV